MLCRLQWQRSWQLKLKHNCDYSPPNSVALNFLKFLWGWNVPCLLSAQGQTVCCWKSQQNLFCFLQMVRKKKKSCLQLCSQETFPCSSEMVFVTIPWILMAMRNKWCLKNITFVGITLLTNRKFIWTFQLRSYLDQSCEQWLFGDLLQLLLIGKHRIHGPFRQQPEEGEVGSITTILWCPKQTTRKHRDLVAQGSSFPWQAT